MPRKRLFLTPGQQRREREREREKKKEANTNMEIGRYAEWLIHLSLSRSLDSRLSLSLCVREQVYLSCGLHLVQRPISRVF